MNELERFVRATLLGTLGAIVVGLAAFGLFRMWDWALGFAAGALVSLVNFRLITASVARIMGQPVSRARARGSWWATSLIRLLGAVVLLFLVIRYLPVNLIGLALGLLAVQLGMGVYLVVRSWSPEGGTIGTEDRKP